MNIEKFGKLMTGWMVIRRAVKFVLQTTKWVCIFAASLFITLLISNQIAGWMGWHTTVTNIVIQTPAVLLDANAPIMIIPPVEPANPEIPNFDKYGPIEEV